MRVCVVVCVQLLFCHEFCGFVLFYVQNMCKCTNVGATLTGFTLVLCFLVLWCSVLK